jgi:hypothetical protein
MDLPLTVCPEAEQNFSSQYTIRFRAAGKGSLNVPKEIPVDCSVWEQAKRAVEKMAAVRLELVSKIPFRLRKISLRG